jgi:hypothetical protein
MRSRKPALVSQYLENISGEMLERFQDMISDYARRRHGIYALYDGTELYYVGLATNLRTRLKQHLTDRHRGLWNRFSIYLTIGDDHIRELEALVLRIVKPKGNRQIGRLRQSENLKKMLARDLRKRYRKELASLIGRKFKDEENASRMVDDDSPVLLKYITGPMKIRARFKGKTLKARVRSTGTISFNGKAYNSPSDAARVACGRRTCNGWKFWTYERAPGDWVLLDELRR